MPLANVNQLPATIETESAARCWSPVVTCIVCG